MYVIILIIITQNYPTSTNSFTAYFKNLEYAYIIKFKHEYSLSQLEINIHKYWGEFPIYNKYDKTKIYCTILIKP